jgi:hypothetical protein
MERRGRIRLAGYNFVFEGNVVVFVTGNLPVTPGYGHFGDVLNYEVNGVWGITTTWEF